VPQFYHNLITEESFRFLQTLRRDHTFVLIGGWAVFMYTRSLKSKDIDIVVEYGELGRLRDHFDVRKNDRLRKYEIKVGTFDVDVYVAHYSDLGVPAEIIRSSAVARDGFLVPPAVLLLLLKLYAWHTRRGSAKGRKDELDILSLAFSPECDWDRYRELVAAFRFETYHREFLALLRSTRSVPEFGFNEQATARLKKRVLQRFAR